MSKGQAVMLDFLLAAFIFSIIFSAIIFSWQNVQENIQRENQRGRLKRAAIRGVDFLVQSRGIPIDWNEDNVEIVGLKELDELSTEKIDLVENMEYEALKTGLGLEGFEFRLILRGENRDLLKGKAAPPKDTISVRRLALLEGRPVRVDLMIWEVEN